MRRTPPTVRDVLFAMATTTATAGVLVALRAWWLAPAVALAALSPFLEWRPASRALAGLLEAALRLSIVLAAAVVWFTRPFPLFPELVATRLLPFLAALLSGLATLFVLGRRTFPPQRTLVPALVALMVVASADPSPQGFGISLVPAFRSAGHSGFAELFLLVSTCVVLAVWAGTLVSSGPAWHGRDTAPLAAVVLVSAALATLGILGLPAAQPHVERVVAEAFDSAATGLGSGSTLGEFDALAVSRRRVLDLRASEQARLRLRAEVSTRFDGRRWTPDDAFSGPRSLLAGAPAPPLDDPRMLLADLGPWFAISGTDDTLGLRVRIIRHAYEEWPLLLPRDVALVTAPTPWLERDGRDLLRAPGPAPVRVYGAVLLARPLRRRPPDEGETAECLALPPRVAPRVEALARNLSRGSTSVAERVARTVEHLQTHYRYTLQPGPFHAGGDPVAEFLFDKKEGYCEYFATAAVLLLRLQGVPARFVKGFSVGPHNHHGDGLYVVRDSDAHAWVDAYVPGAGWTEVDPTPPADFAAAHPVPGRAARLLEQLRAVAAELRARMGGPGLARLLHWLAEAVRQKAVALVRQGWPAPTLLACLTAWLLRARARRLVERWRRRTARADGSLPRELLLAVEALEDRWRELGRPRPASRGLREHARLVASATVARSEVTTADAVIDLYYRARFGGQQVSLADLDVCAGRPREKRTAGPPQT